MQWLIKNRFYCGQVRYKPKGSDGTTWLPGKHEPIITRELFDQVEATRKKRAQARRRYAHNKHTYLLSGLARCHLCDFNLRASFGKGGSYLRERSHWDGYDCPAGRRSVPVTVIDPQVEGIVCRLRLPDDWQARLSEFMAERKGLGEIEKERRRVSAALERLADLYQWGHVDRSKYKRRRAELEAELSALVMPGQTAVAEAGRYLEQVGALWDDADLPQRRDLLHAILETVRVDVLARRVLCVEPKPEFVVLFQQMEELEEENGRFYIREAATGC
jgi:hypothetical protein